MQEEVHEEHMETGREAANKQKEAENEGFCKKKTEEVEREREKSVWGPCIAAIKMIESNVQLRSTYTSAHPEDTHGEGGRLEMEGGMLEEEKY